MNLNSEKKFLIYLFILSFLARSILGVLFIKEGFLPHDIDYYIQGAKFFIEGELYNHVQTNGIPFAYGPLTAIFFALFSKILGFSYFFVKLPVIIIDSLSVLVFYYILKNFTTEHKSKIVSIIYSFSYLVLFSGGILGNDDSLFLFFMLLSIKFLLDHKYGLSSFSLAISAGFKLVPIILIPVIIIFLLAQDKKFKNTILYLLTFCAVFSLILLPFYIESGNNALFPYLSATNMQHFSSTDGIAPINTIKLTFAIYENVVSYLKEGHFIDAESNPLNSSTNDNTLNSMFSEYSKYIFILGYILVFFYMLKFRITNKNTEFIRNCFIVMLFGLFFSKVLYELFFIFVVPFIFILISKEDIYIGKKEKIGILSVFLALIIFSVNNKDGIISLHGGILEVIFILLVLFGSYLTMPKIIRKEYTLLVASCALFASLESNAFYGFTKFLLPTTVIGSNTYGYYITYFLHLYFTSIIIIIAMVFLFHKIHKITLKSV